MKKFFLIIYGIVMVITVIASLYLYTHQKPTSVSNEEVPQPSSGDAGPLYVYSPEGERGPLIDPTKGAVSIDQETGNTVLAEKPEYILEYFPEGKTFNIALLGSNLREARLAAEQDLLTRFNITPEQACSLSVLVGTIVSVSQGYAGQQLGLSFCPGRVDLPTVAPDPAEPGSSAGAQPDAAL